MAAYIVTHQGREHALSLHEGRPGLYEVILDCLLYTSNTAVAAAIASAIQAVDPELIMVCLSNSRMVEAAQAAGIRCVEEVFADRAYTREGKLVPRSQPGAVIHDAQQAAERVLAMVRDRQVIAIDGTPVPLKAQTVCVHGDTTEAIEMVRYIRARLEAEHVELKAFGA